jgi:hypothetical protein
MQAASTASRDRQVSETSRDGDLQEKMNTSGGDVRVLTDVGHEDLLKLKEEAETKLEDMKQKMEEETRRLKNEAVKMELQVMLKLRALSTSTKNQLVIEKTQLEEKMKSLTEQLAEKTEQLATSLAEKTDQLAETNKRFEKDMDDQKAQYEKSLDSLRSRFDDQEKDKAEEEHEEEPGIALEDQLRITEQSAKAIDLLSNHLFSTVWQTCSKNTFGNKNK